MLRKIKHGQKVFTENDKSKEMYFIREGAVSIQKKKDSEIVELAVLKKGSIFGEMAVMDGKPRSATAVALEDSELHVITEDEYLERVKDVPEWYLALLRVTSERLRQANEKLKYEHHLQTVSNVSQLLVMILKKHGRDQKLGEETSNLDLKHVKNELVEVLGINRTPMNEALNFLEKKNMILLFSNKLTVSDSEELLSYSKFLKSINTDEKFELLDDELFQYLSELKDLFDKTFAKSEIITYSVANFKTEIEKNKVIPVEKMDWFLITTQKMKAVQFINSKGEETPFLKQLETGGQLKFNSHYLSRILKEEQFKRLGT